MHNAEYETISWKAEYDERNTKLPFVLISQTQKFMIFNEKSYFCAAFQAKGVSTQLPLSLSQRRKACI